MNVNEATPIDMRKIEEIVGEELQGSMRWSAWRIDPPDDEGGRAMLILTSLGDGRRLTVPLPIQQMQSPKEFAAALGDAIGKAIRDDQFLAAAARAVEAKATDPAWFPGRIIPVSALPTVLYRRREPPFEAIQFTGENVEAVIRFVSNQTNKSNAFVKQVPIPVVTQGEVSMGFETRISGYGDFEDCCVGDWLVKGDNYRRFGRYTDEEFKQRFEVMP